MKEFWRQFRATVLSNRWLKLAALILAAATWYAVHAATSFDEDVADIPLQVRVDPGWAVLERSVDTVDVLLRGSREDVRMINRAQLETSVDLRGRDAEGAVRVRLDGRNVQAPRGVRVARVTPSEITITLSREVEKTVPVKVDFLGEPPPGLEVEGSVVTPAAVVIKGPRGRIEPIETVRTIPVSLEGQYQTFKTRVPVAQPNNVWLARLDPEKVMVEVALTEHAANRQIEDVGVGVMMQPGRDVRVRLATNRVVVHLEGAPLVVKSLQKEQVNAFVDCKGLEAAMRYELPVQVNLPPGVRAQRIEPPVIQVELSRGL